MSDMMTQEEIEAMVRGEQKDSDAPEYAPDSKDAQADEQSQLNDEERDILGELGNICMGTAATTMYTLLGKRVSITTPMVLMRTKDEMKSDHKAPFVAVSVSYTEGIEGDNLLLLKEEDAAVITDLLMGGEGIIQGDIVLDEIHLSAISELMNQMVGSAATSMSNVLHIPINISTPTAQVVSIADQTLSKMFEDSPVIIKISFNMEIEGLLKSEIMQVMPYKFGQNLVERVKEATNDPKPMVAEVKSEPAPAAMKTAPAPAPNPVAKAPAPAPVMSVPAPAPAPMMSAPAPMMNAPMPAAPEPAYNPYFQPAASASPPRVDVKAVQFQTFGASNEGPNAFNENMNIIMDVPLQVSVELGKSRKSIRDILEFGMGSIIVLDKLAGELVDVMVNGKLIARGEVVVIDESYGVRITDIVTPEKRMSYMR